MTENMKKFLEAVSQNNELVKKLSQATKEDLIAMAQELGIELTEDDFVQNNELSENELDAVAGGVEFCACFVGGGGTAETMGGKICVCVLGGGGGDMFGNEVCACVGGGYGAKT